MKQYLTEEMLQEVRTVENELAWLKNDPTRTKRWQNFFESSSEEIKRAVDLAEDPVLNHYRVSPEERLMRRRVTEICMDNMVRNAGAGNDSMGVLHEATTTTSIASNVTWQLPLIRKIWPRNFLWELVSVQPMSQAQGRMFVLDVQYGSSGGAYASGTSIYDHEDPSYSDDPGEAQEPKRLNLKITSSNVEAESKKIAGDWTIEAMQDMQSYHNLALEPEIVKMFGLEIDREINRTYMNQLVNYAATNTNWSSTQPITPNPWSNATPRQFAESIIDAVEDANRAIKDDIYEDANVIVCGTAFASRLRKLNTLRLTKFSDALTGGLGTGPNLFGMLDDRYKLFEDPGFKPSDKALILHKSNNWMYTGAAFCPYIPVYSTPTIYNTKMQPGKGYMSRNAFKITNNKFFGTITVT